MNKTTWIPGKKVISFERRYGQRSKIRLIVPRNEKLLRLACNVLEIDYEKLAKSLKIFVLTLSQNIYFVTLRLISSVREQITNSIIYIFHHNNGERTR